MINLRNFNISISNPSNLIEEDTRNINSRYISPLSTTVVCNDSFQYTTTRDIRGINSFDIMPINDSRQPIEHSNITLRYYNKANLDLIEIRDPMEKRLENGSILITTSLTITNNQNAQLSFQQIPVIPLYYFNNLVNLTSFTCKTTVDNSSYNTSNYQIADSWLWSPSFNVFPNQVMHINIQAVFEEKTNA
jgi:hypothetical protein